MVYNKGCLNTEIVGWNVSVSFPLLSCILVVNTVLLVVEWSKELEVPVSLLCFLEVLDFDASPLSYIRG